MIPLHRVLPYLFVGAVLLVPGGCNPSESIPPSPPLVGLEADVEDHLNRTYTQLQLAVKEQSGMQLAVAFGDAAISYHGYDMVRMAQACYQRALVHDPDSQQWRYLLARILQKEGEAKQALQLYNEILEHNANHPPTLVAAAELKFQSGDAEGARVWFQRLLRLDPRSAPALSGLGRISLQQGNAQEAVDYLQEALRYSPASSGLRYPYGLALRDAGRDEEAQQQMQMRGPSFPRVRNPWLDEVRNRPIGARIPLNRGTTFFTAGQYRKALEQFQEAVKVAPDSATAQLNLGSALVKLQRSDEALGCYEEAIRLDPGATTAWFDLGVIHAENGDEIEAIRCYDQALVLDDGHHSARFNRANALRRQQQYEEAAREMKRVRQQVPGNEVAWIAEVVCYLRLEQVEVARTPCREGQMATGNGPRLVSLMARIEATSPEKDHAQLEQTLGELAILRSKQTTLELVESTAMVLAALTRYGEAQQWQESAIEAARAAKRFDIIDRLQGNQARYSRGEPAVDPWPEASSEGSSSPGTGEGVGSESGSTSQ